MLANWVVSMISPSSSVITSPARCCPEEMVERMMKVELGHGTKRGGLGSHSQSRWSSSSMGSAVVVSEGVLAVV